MLRLLLICPGSTEFDEEGRIKGNLDMPMTPHGTKQVDKVVADLSEHTVETVYAAAGQACEATARTLATASGAKIKLLPKLTNLDLGLWQGKRIEEVRQTQSRIFRLWQESPECICPPEGETLDIARGRVQSALDKIRKKHSEGIVALVAPEPMATLVRSILLEKAVGDLWQAECRCGVWEMIDLLPQSTTVGT